MQNVAELESLFEARQRLSDLLAKLEGNGELSKALLDFIGDDKARRGPRRGQAGRAVTQNEEGR